MARFEPHQEYQRLVGDEFEEDSPPGEDLLVHVPEGLKDSWHHIKNLDNFFTRIYHFHQKNGFACMMLSEFFELVQFLFVVLFTTFLFNCVEYDVLFANKFINHTGSGYPERNKVTLPDAILPTEECTTRIRNNGWIIFLLIMAVVFWIYRLVKVICNLLSYWEIRMFYIKALKIPTVELCNYTWQEVQARLIQLQREQQMCIHKKELTELDIYHRILRFKNYMVAMVNKSLLPVRLSLPFLGDVIFFSQGLKYNFELIFFWGPGSLFQNKWNLHPKYKRSGSRLELARQLSRTVLMMGVANLLLCPFILVWQILYAFFSYTEVIKREPGSLGARRWSLFGRLYLRHFNELDHELQARLSCGYKPAAKYMNSFTSPLLTVIAQNLAFFSGSILAVLITLTVYDEDVLTVQHILTAITVLGIMVTVCRSFIPDEYMVWCPEQLLQCVLAHIHYMPDHWKGNANKSETRDELAQLFQYKAWLSEGQTEASVYQQAENGKTELSLMHFTITNPQWHPPQGSSVFISHLKEKVQYDAACGPPAQHLLSDTPLCNSLLSNESANIPENLIMSVLTHSALLSSPFTSRDRALVQPCSTASAAASVLASLPLSHHPTRTRSHTLLLENGAESSLYRSDRTIIEESMTDSAGSGRSQLLANFASTEMSLHAIYMHELHQQTVQPQQMRSVSEIPSSITEQSTAPVPRLGSPETLAAHSQLPLGGWTEEASGEVPDGDRWDSEPEVPSQV
ncbi:autophagy-related protein 9B isoform X2 [Narcine bancroftii]|uniref:autophagy-related protein 9B isoform X2 n=1 Tax=Narcine bancroftii TaxID=1343680 RepID=UPI0038315A7E